MTTKTDLMNEDQINEKWSRPTAPENSDVTNVSNLRSQIDFSPLFLASKMDVTAGHVHCRKIRPHQFLAHTPPSTLYSTPPRPCPPLRAFSLPDRDDRAALLPSLPGAVLALVSDRDFVASCS